MIFLLGTIVRLYNLEKTAGALSSSDHSFHSSDLMKDKIISVIKGCNKGWYQCQNEGSENSLDRIDRY